ncbi:MAG: Ig-like domain repeat protein, partial [Gemmatimonadota bacterium]|nr:Ig-like domain repeat protein [Gemmatimonadota bacterium]
TAHTPDPVTLGNPIAVTVSVATTTGATPMGSVLVSDGLGATCGIASLSGSGGTATGSCNLTPTSAGVRTLTAAYTPSSGNFTGSSFAGVSHTVSPAASFTTITADTPDPSVTGETVTVSVSVTGSGGTPTGTVTVGDGTVSCPVTLAGGAGSCNLTFATTGPRTLTATYGGDANFGGSSDTEAHTVNAASTSTSISGSSPSSTTVGQAYTVSYTVSVIAPGVGTPVGNVTVSDGTAQCVGTVGSGSCSLTSTTAGSKTLVATYTGDANFSGSVSVGVGHTVNQASSTTTITGSSPDPSSVGQAYTVNFTVTSGGGTPTGSVTVSDGTDQCVGTAAAGSCSLTSTTVGAKTLIATYAGDVNFTGSVSLGVSHTVGSSGSTTTITGDTPDPTVTGEAYTVSFTVTATGGTPTGNVTVSDGTGDSCIGTVAVGSCSLTSTTAGGKTLTATYAGDGTFPGSTSSGVSHTVSLASTTTAITGHTPDPSIVNQAYTVSVTVAASAPGAGTPTGSVSVSDGAAACQVALTSGAGSCQLTSTTGGTKTLTATYAGDANFTTSVSPGVSHTVNLIPTTTSITSDSPDPSVVGQGYTVDFDVLPNGGTRGDTVEVSDGSATCRATANQGSCTLISTTGGTKSLVATHLATATHAASSSAGVSHTVSAAPTTTTIISHTPDPSVIGQTVTVSFTVTSGFGTPAGNVTVSDGTDSCTDTVAAGSCSLTPTTFGAKTLTATYVGDPTHAGSSDNVSHQVDPFGAADHLTFGVQPSDVTAGNSITPAVEVRIEDAFGNLVTSATDAVTVSIASDPNGSGTSTLTGTIPVNASGGIAKFSDLAIDLTGNGFTLQASSGSLTAATSAAFNVN